MEIDTMPMEQGATAVPNADAELLKDVDIMDEEEEEEEQVSDLVQLLESAETLHSSDTNQMALDSNYTTILSNLTSILTESQNRYGPRASSIKERAIYSLTRTYCAAAQFDAVVDLLTGSTCRGFFDHATKAKCAKVVRAVLDLLCSIAPDQFHVQAQVCRNVIAWCKAEKRTFLRQRVETKLAAILFAQKDYSAALTLMDDLLLELKKLDDKQLLVEAHLLQSKIHHALRGIAKSKAALTASRTCANAIYVAPALQATIDSMSGILHCEEGDYNTAHSYFLEAFESLDTLDDKEKALQCLKYMMLCRILDSLTKALKLSAKGGVGAKTDKADVDISAMLTSKQAIKYAGKDVEAMTAVANAASKRSLQEFESITQSYTDELVKDVLIQHHLSKLREQLLESNLIRIIEPYSCVEISHVAYLMEMQVSVVEKKLSQMILDKKLNGILDQGKGHLIVYEETDADMTMEKGLQVIANVDDVVTALFTRSNALRSMMA